MAQVTGKEGTFLAKKIDHIGIAVASLKDAIAQFSVLTGFLPQTETVAAQHVDVAMFPVGGVRIELLEGTTSESAVAKFISKRGPGIHHICFEVEDLDKSKKVLSEQGLRFIEGVSAEGASNTRVAFLHPHSMAGILIELVEYPKNNSTESA